MTSLNLTRVEAAERARILSVQRYDIALDLIHGDKEFGSITTVKFTVKEPGDTFIDLRAARVREVILDGNDITEGAITLDEKGYDPTHGVALRDLTAGEHTLRITADCEYSRTGQGLHRFVDPADGETYLYTQFETADAKRVFACFDQPDLKARYKLTVHTPDNWKVISNAEQDVQKTADGEVHISRIDYPLSTYLVALCAGPYHEVRSSWTGTLTRHPETPEDQPDTITVPFGLYCRASLAPHLDAERIFEQTKQGFDWYHRHFGMAYPFGKYDQVFCPEYNMGAMENAGCVTFRDEYIFTSKVTRYLYERRCDTILHELAHMWFGDLVTMEWWGDLWLNESFATWAAAISQSEETEFDTAWVTFANIEKSWAYRQDQLPSTHPVFTDASDVETVEQNFDGITYAKGASVLRQMVAWVGQENFMAALKKYFDKHAWGNTVLDDLLVELEETSGRDVRAWSAKWLETAGVNTLTVEVADDAEGTITSLGIRQSYAAGYETLRPHRAVIGFYDLTDGKLTRTDRIELDIDGELTEVAEAVGKKRPDLILLNDEDLAFAKVRLDERSIDTAVKHLGDIDSSVARGVVWGSLWDTVRDAQMPARQYVEFVLNNIGKETNSTALRTQLGNLSIALRSFVNPEFRDETRERAADRLWSLACAAQPDSDSQLQLVQAFVNQTRTEAQYENVQRLFEGDIVLDGLEIDTDLRWTLICRLATGGRVSAAQIDAEAANDNTATGQQYAAQAYASQPSEQVKAEYWNKIMVTGELSNMIQRYAIFGFKSGEPELIAPYIEPYFELIEGIWRSRSHEISMQIIGGMYPSEPTAELLERTEAYLASLPEDAAALRRQIAEARDGVARALKVQAADV